jgi:Ni,Fe-hydrogenase III component G
MNEAQTIGAAELPKRFEGLQQAGYRLALVAAHHDQPEHASGSGLRVVYLFLAPHPAPRVELLLHIDPADLSVPTLAGLSFPAGRFEREMHDLYGIKPIGHPLPRRLVRHPHWPAGWYPMRQDAGPAPDFPQTDEQFPFLTVEGPGVYEIPVGPVHAGLIERDTSGSPSSVRRS